MPKWEGKKLVLDFTPKEGEVNAKPHKTTREIQDNKLILVG